MHKIAINLSPSRQFIFLMILILSGALFVTITLSTSWWIKAILIAMIVSYGFYILYFYGLLKSPSSIIRIHLFKDEWNIVDNSGAFSAELCGSSTITMFCAVLRFKLPNQKWKRSCSILAMALTSRIKTWFLYYGNAFALPFQGRPLKPIFFNKLKMTKV